MTTKKYIPADRLYGIYNRYSDTVTGRKAARDAFSKERDYVKQFFFEVAKKKRDLNCEDYENYLKEFSFQKKVNMAHSIYLFVLNYLMVLVTACSVTVGELATHLSCLLKLVGGIYSGAIAVILPSHDTATHLSNSSRIQLLNQKSFEKKLLAEKSEQKDVLVINLINLNLLDEPNNTTLTRIRGTKNFGITYWTHRFTHRHCGVLEILDEELELEELLIAQDPVQTVAALRALLKDKGPYNISVVSVEDFVRSYNRRMDNIILKEIPAAITISVYPQTKNLAALFNTVINAFKE